MVNNNLPKSLLLLALSYDLYRVDDNAVCCITMIRISAYNS